MAGPVSICCCDLEPQILEEKQFKLSVPFPGFTRYVSNTDHSTDWETRHYLTRTIVSTDVYGASQTQVFTYDKDNGSIVVNSTTTDPGYVGNTGSVISSTYDTTHLYEVWRETGVGDGGKVTTLSDVYDLDEFIDTWRTRMDAMIATEDMRDTQTISARRGAYSGFGGSATDTVTPTFDFASFGTSGAYSQIELKPWKGWTGLGTPAEDAWDSTYYFTDLSNAYSISAVEYSRSGYLGQSPGLADTLVDYGLPLWDGSQFSYNKVIWGVFIKTCLSLPTGMDCDQVDYETDTDYQLGDVALIDFDYSTGVCTQVAPELQLSRGWYSFDGRQMVIHSGSKIHPSTDVVGIDGITTPYFGCSSPRIEVGVDPHLDSRMVADYC